MDVDDIDYDALNEVCDAYEDPNLKASPGPGPQHIEALVKNFGHTNFRPLQWKVISAIINDKRDVCAVMSTGYGKSLCFQYPSLFLNGLTLVISPLISLMEDQVLALQVANISACLLGTAQKQKRETMDDILANKYSLVYLTPEFCLGDLGESLLKQIGLKLKVVLIAIDEAHCISGWGHDFRYQYRRLSVLKEIFPETPIIAVTATATPKVCEDIKKSLKLRNPLQVCSGFDRPNLYFQIFEKVGSGIQNDLHKMLSVSNQFDGPTIIYCITRKDTEEVASLLEFNGIESRCYHAGMTLNARKEVHELFVKDKIGVIVATIAFGMGIDKPDIKNVIHYGCSGSIESYYQEVGRAGRDGLPAICTTFYNSNDFQKHRFLNSKTSSVSDQRNKGLKNMEMYLTSTSCRRKFILEHFEDNVDKLTKPRPSCCDNCTKRLMNNGKTLSEKYEGLDENGNFDFTEDALIMLQTVTLLGNFGLGTFVKYVRGAKCPKVPEVKIKNPLYGKGKGKPEAWWQAIIRILIQESYLNDKLIKQQRFSYTTVFLTEKGISFLISEDKLVLEPPSTILQLLKKKPTQRVQEIVSTRNVQPSTSKLKINQTTETPDETEAEFNDRMQLYHKLVDKRGEIALHLDCMPYMVASNAALMTISRLKPKTLAELRNINIDGFAEAKVLKFGEKFLQVVRDSMKESSDLKILTIKDVLNMHPLPDENLMNATAQVSYTLFQSGFTPKEIAEKRGVSIGTIVSHLVDALKCGNSIKMIDLGVNEEVRDHVIKAFREICKDGYAKIKHNEVKQHCSPDISYDHIKMVLAYIKVREHLKSLNIPYKDFEDFEYSDINITESANSTSRKKDRPLSPTTVGNCDSPSKKIKTTDVNEIVTDDVFDAILDSPPRENVSEVDNAKMEQSEDELEHKTEICNKSNNVPVKNVKKGKAAVLPPWLVVKKS